MDSGAPVGTEAISSDTPQKRLQGRGRIQPHLACIRADEGSHEDAARQARVVVPLDGLERPDRDLRHGRNVRERQPFRFTRLAKLCPERAECDRPSVPLVGSQQRREQASYPGVARFSRPLPPRGRHFATFRPREVRSYPASTGGTGRFPPGRRLPWQQRRRLYSGSFRRWRELASRSSAGPRPPVARLPQAARLPASSGWGTRSRDMR